MRFISSIFLCQGEQRLHPQTQIPSEIMIHIVIGVINAINLILFFTVFKYLYFEVRLVRINSGVFIVVTVFCILS